MSTNLLPIEKPPATFKIFVEVGDSSNAPIARSNKGLLMGRDNGRVNERVERVYSRCKHYWLGRRDLVYPVFVGRERA